MKDEDRVEEYHAIRSEGGPVKVWHSPSNSAVAVIPDEVGDSDHRWDVARGIATMLVLQGGLSSFLAELGAVFREYERSHRNKASVATTEGDRNARENKAQQNADLADRIDGWLKRLP